MFCLIKKCLVTAMYCRSFVWIKTVLNHRIGWSTSSSNSNYSSISTRASSSSGSNGSGVVAVGVMILYFVIQPVIYIYEY